MGYPIDYGILRTFFGFSLWILSLVFKHLIDSSLPIWFIWFVVLFDYLKIVNANTENGCGLDWMNISVNGTVGWVAAIYVIPCPGPNIPISSNSANMIHYSLLFISFLLLFL